MRIIIYFLFFSFTLISISQAEDISSLYHPSDNTKMNNFIMDKASQDISSNISIWVKLKNELQGENALGWELILGDKIPSQPIAVIEIISLTKTDIASICPRHFMEGSEYYEIERWMNRAIDTLNSFTMTDSSKDDIRKQCLLKIQIALENKENWFNYPK